VHHKIVKKRGLHQSKTAQFEASEKLYIFQVGINIMLSSI